MNKEVIDALKNLNIPVSFQTYTGKAESYITFFTYLDLVIQHADDKENETGYFVQVDLWSKNDYLEIVKGVHQAMLGAGFLKKDFHDLYEDDTKVYHKVMRFFKEVEK